MIFFFLAIHEKFREKNKELVIYFSLLTTLINFSFLFLILLEHKIQKNTYS